jgi:tetratricopeptide (TPR) repeat protein
MQRNRLRKAAVTLAALTVGQIVWLRSVLLWCARLAGWVRVRLQAGWLGLTLLYLFGALLVVLHGLMVRAIPLVSPPALAPAHTWAAAWQHALQLLRVNARPTAIWFFHGATGPWIKSLALAAIIATVRIASETRRRIVILSFANLSGDNDQKDFVNALPRRLMTELAEIADIHTQVRDDPGNLSLDSGPAPRLEVDPTSSATSGLKGALSGVKVPIGPMSIPLDGAVTVLSTLLRGPQIVGSLQCTSEGLLIEASLSGGGHYSTWRVTEQDANRNRARDESGTGVADLMVRQLAYRIFTHLNAQHLGTSSWRALGHYTEGLRAVRDAALERRPTTKRVLALQRAQQEFFGAFREDVRFVRSRYNLGVILFSQRSWQPACEVFQAVVNDIEGDPLPSPPGSPASKRARRDLASAHFAAASAFCAQVRDLYDRQKSNHEWAERANFQAANLDRNAGYYQRILEEEAPAPSDPRSRILTRLTKLITQLEKADQRPQSERYPTQLQRLERAHLMIRAKEKEFRESADGSAKLPDPTVIHQALDYLIAGQKLLVARYQAQAVRAQVSAANAGMARSDEFIKPDSPDRWIAQRVDYHAEMALRIDPAASDPWNLLGERANSLDEKRACFRKASALIWLQLCLAAWKNAPTPALLMQAVTFLANLSCSNPDAEGAVGEMDQALFLDPSNAAKWASLGKLHLMNGSFDEAVESFRNANRERELGLHWLWIACTYRMMTLKSGNTHPDAGSWRKKEREALSRAVEGRAGESLFPAPPWGASRYPAAPPQPADLPSSIYRDGRFELFQTELDQFANCMPDLTDQQKEALRIWGQRRMRRLQWMLLSIEIRKADFQNLAVRMTAQLPGMVFPEEMRWKQFVRWINRSYRTDVAARESLVGATYQFLGIFNKARFAIAQEQFEQLIQLVSKAMEAGPIEANQRMLLAGFYFFTGLPDQSQEEITNALNIRPDANLESWSIDTALRKFHDITDKRTRAEALRRIVAVCKDGADREAYDVNSNARLGIFGIWHYYLGVFSLDTRDYPTAQRCFATCRDRRQYPIESLQLLCYAHFRCGAFEAAEEAYKSIIDLLCQLLPPVPKTNSQGKPLNPEKRLRKMKALRSAQEFNALGKWTEQLSPAWNRAMAATHTAAAMAEQGLTAEACRRWKVGRKWAKIAQQPDRRLFLEAAQYLCQGMILLNAGISAGPVEDPDPLNPPEAPSPPAPPAPSSLAAASPQSGIPKATQAVQEAAASGAATTAALPAMQHTLQRVPGEATSPATPLAAVACCPAPEDPRVAQLKKAIRCFTIAIGYAQDPANRADSNFRIGIACDSLAHLDAANADSWKRQGRRALRNVEDADRRDEYKNLIGPLMKKLGGDIDQSIQPMQSAYSSPSKANTTSASAEPAQETVAGKA